MSLIDSTEEQVRHTPPTDVAIAAEFTLAVDHSLTISGGRDNLNQLITSTDKLSPLQALPTMHVSEDTLQLATQGLQAMQISVKQNNESASMREAPSIANFNYDVIHLIFGYVNIGTAVCLGLTCRHLYRCLKMKYPLDIRLSTMICDHETNEEWQTHQPHIHLSHILKSWMGDGYRLGVMRQHLYLKKEVYGGESNSPEEEALYDRYKDYLDIRYFRVMVDDWEPSWIFGLGSKWNDEVIEQMIVDFKCWDDFGVWHFFWKKTNVYKKHQELIDGMIEEYMWEKWSEGIALMGF